MKIILDEDVKGKGKRGQMIEVADGYGSYLIREKKASLATESVINKWKKIHDEENLQDILGRDEAIKKKSVLESAVLNFSVKTNGDKVFGSITSSDVAKRINEVYGYDISKRDVSVPKITLLGDYSVSVTLYKDIKACTTIRLLKG